VAWQLFSVGGGDMNHLVQIFEDQQNIPQRSNDSVNIRYYDDVEENEVQQVQQQNEDNRNRRLSRENAFLPVSERI
jgi:hypothetical protein